ncbi:DUF1496 domain-containing protein [Aeromonas rivuli]|uniref:DUF1496 domain-containing protein n=1 Tax=Aeromonas rivuli TaxID=648794 RepID=UPI0005A73B1E|nr:DUF1496 domain-containing protein [Aeromonas rivuli]
MKSVGIMLALWGLSTVAVAEPLRHSTRVGTDLLLPLGSLPERVCWFADQKYSLGAQLEQGGSWLVCAPINSQESNGPLAWRSVQQQPSDEAQPDAQIERIQTPR